MTPEPTYLTDVGVAIARQQMWGRELGEWQRILRAADRMAQMVDVVRGVGYEPPEGEEEP